MRTFLAAFPRQSAELDCGDQQLGWHPVGCVYNRRSWPSMKSSHGLPSLGDAARRARSTKAGAPDNQFGVKLGDIRAMRQDDQDRS